MPVSSRIPRIVDCTRFVAATTRLPARLVSSGLAAALASSLVLFAAPPAPAAAPGPAVRAAGWLAGQVHHGRLHNGQFDFDDWGLTIDGYWALVATGTHRRTTSRMIGAISHHAGAYVQLDGDYSAGATAKALLARRVARLDTTVRIGGHPVDLRHRLVAMVAPSGRVRDEGETDYSSTLSQSLAVLAFARSGRASQRVVDYLLGQRCAAGYFRESLRARSCAATGAAPYVDSTAFALQALVAARADGAALPRGAVRDTAAWLVSVQNPNGSWSARGTARDVNANSTGLAAQALAAPRRTSASAQAIEDSSVWVADHLQITTARADGGPAADDVGAIARTRPDLHAAVESGITRSTRDSFRRATAQAVLTFVPVPLTQLSAG